MSMNTSNSSVNLSKSFCRVRTERSEARINPEDFAELEASKARYEAAEYKRRNQELEAELAALKATKQSPKKSVVPSPLKRLPIKKLSENVNPNIQRRTSFLEDDPSQLRSIIESLNRENLSLRSEVRSLKLWISTQETKHIDELRELEGHFRKGLQSSRKQIRQLAAEVSDLKYSKCELLDFSLSDEETNYEG